MTVLTPGKLMGLRRIADETGRFKMLAVDQRPPIESLVANARGADRPDSADVAGLKGALIETLAGYASAVLVDPQYAYPEVIPLLPRDAGLLLTLEDDAFVEGDGGRLSSAIPDWTAAKIAAAGGDGVKVLAWYRPDADAGVREHQQQFVAGIGEECARLDIPFVFELLLYPLPSETGHTTDYVEHPQKRSEHVIESVETFASPRFGVDVFKLESPVAAALVSGPAAVPEGSLRSAFSALDRAAGRPWVMLSAGADPTSFFRILELAYEAGASGYLAGRAIWWDACKSNFPDWDAMRSALRHEAAPYMERINALTDDRATPWHRHRRYGTEGPVPPRAGAEFRVGYMAEEP